MDNIFIPESIKEYLQDNPRAGRNSLVKVFNIPTAEARFYCSAFKGTFNEGLKKRNEEVNMQLEEFSSGLIDKLRKEKIVVDVPFSNPFRGKIIEDAVLLLSDIHIGRTNTFMNPDTNRNEVTYNTDIMIKEANNLVESMWKIISLLSHGYKIDRLWIFGLGDFVDNDLIFKGQTFFIDMDAGDQLWTGTKIIADMFRAFLKIFKEVKVVSVPGNHGRHTARREASRAGRNFDYHFAKILEVVFQAEDRISFDIPNSFFYYPKIYNWRYFIHHGDDVYSWMSLPYYGITRKSKARKTEVDYQIETIGHFHTTMEVPTSSKTLTLVNGSWINKEIYAWEKFGVFSKAEQTFFGVSPKRPRTWSFTLEL